MTMRLTPQNATITTATVAVKTLTIGSKQVTLAVYRQLQEQRMASTAVPWGRINHCPNNACRQPARDRGFGLWPDHCHVVWQQGDELRRATVWRNAISADYARDRPSTGQVADPEGWQRVMALPQLFIAA
ncbi:hypothetical protein ACIQPT_34750 [Streptomyces sp. NPDC091289]|uniref:hypothetical protein n=1 Tax=Streptomyces sp. NPDC091289 TaxID=3365989 RepID=UPI00380D983E